MAAGSLMLKGESTLTSRYQTTIPQVVRNTLGLDKNDKLLYTIQKDGSVLLSKSDEHEEDNVLKDFLNFLANEISNNPQNVKSVDSKIVQKAQNLVSEVAIDMDAPLADQDD